MSGDPISLDRWELLEPLSHCLNYLAFMDEKDHSFVTREFGGGEEIICSVALVQAILSELYDNIEGLS